MGLAFSPTTDLDALQKDLDALPLVEYKQGDL